MKKDIKEFMAKYPNCQKVKAEHQRPRVLIEEIDTSTMKWEDINLYFVVGLPRTRRKNDSIWLLWIG